MCWSCEQFPLQKTIQSALRGNILGRMSGPREHFPLQKTIHSTLRSNMFGHMCWPCEHFPLQKKQYEVHFGTTSWVICVGHASTFPGKKTIQSTLRSNRFGH